MKSLIYIFIILLASAICSCRSIQYVPVESVKYDSVYLNKIIRDSIHERDSIYIKESGDTVYKYRDRYIYRSKIVRDTVYTKQADTISVPYPVEAQLTKWQKLKQSVGGFAIISFMVIFMIVLVYFIYKLKK